MADYQFTWSAFGDEIDADLATQINVLASESITFIELRSAWGVNVLDLSVEQLQAARSMLDARGFGISAIGSPIGKSPIGAPAAFEHERLERALAACDALGTRLIRVFSFHMPQAEAAQHRDEVIDRMGALAARATEVGATLLHENEKGIFGDTAARCHDLIGTIDSPALRMAFDPANFVQCGVQPMAEAWPLLADYTTHIHIKDAVADGSVRPAGQGDGNIPALLDALRQRGYHGFLTLEPHLAFAGPAGGFSGEAGMRTAVAALRALL